MLFIFGLTEGTRSHSDFEAFETMRHFEMKGDHHDKVIPSSSELGRTDGARPRKSKRISHISTKAAATWSIQTSCREDSEAAIHASTWHKQWRKYQEEPPGKDRSPRRSGTIISIACLGRERNKHRGHGEGGILR